MCVGRCVFGIKLHIMYLRRYTASRGHYKYNFYNRSTDRVNQNSIHPATLKAGEHFVFSFLCRDSNTTWGVLFLFTLLARSRLALALQIAMTMGRFPSLQAMCRGELPWRSWWSTQQQRLRRQWTTSTWHLRTARWRAEWPSWKHTHTPYVMYVH